MFVGCEFGIEIKSWYFWVDVHKSVMLSICSARCVLYSGGSGVKRVHVVLYGLRMRLFVCVHACICCRYAWMFAFAFARFMTLCVDVMAMSSA